MVCVEKWPSLKACGYNVLRLQTEDKAKAAVMGVHERGGGWEGYEISTVHRNWKYEVSVCGPPLDEEMSRLESDSNSVETLQVKYSDGNSDDRELV